MKARKAMLWAAGIIVILLLIIQFTVPAIVKRIVVREARKILNTEVSLESLDLNILNGSVNLRQLTIKNPGHFTGEEIFKVNEIHANVALIPLLAGEVVVQEVALHSPQVTIIRREDGLTNAKILLENLEKAQGKEEKTAPKPKEEKKKMPSICIQKTLIKEGQLRFIDYQSQTPPARASIDNIDLVVENIITPTSSDKKVLTTVNLSAIIPTQIPGNIKLKGQGDFLSEKIDFDLNTIIKSLYLPYLAPFYTPKSPVIVEDGVIDLNSRARCKKNQLNAIQKVKIEKFKLIPGKSGYRETLFGLPVNTVISFFTETGGKLDFDFKVSGDISNPQFHLRPVIKEITARSMEDRIKKGLDIFQESKKILKEGDTEIEEKMKDLGREIKELFKTGK